MFSGCTNLDRSSRRAMSRAVYQLFFLRGFSAIEIFTKSSWEVKVLLDWLYIKTLIYNFVWKVFEAHNIKVSYLKIIVHVNLWKMHFEWMEYILNKLDTYIVRHVNDEYLLRSFFSILAVFLRLRSRPVGTIFYRGFTREY